MTTLCEMYLKRKGEASHQEILSRETKKAQLRQNEILIRKTVSDQLKLSERMTKAASIEAGTTTSAKKKRPKVGRGGNCETHECQEAGVTKCVDPQCRCAVLANRYFCHFHITVHCNTESMIGFKNSLAADVDCENEADGSSSATVLVVHQKKRRNKQQFIIFVECHSYC
jgi:hypothetical protein